MVSLRLEHAKIQCLRHTEEVKGKQLASIGDYE
uniref:Uncharacterized protein n=1 Tax=Physcomitrium patens TaxID=3218 RepID=A0A2K1JZG4_PHYPA|nr:hypothetical protein PHYPA_014036 [Physcomitrium patens]